MYSIRSTTALTCSDSNLLFKKRESNCLFVFVTTSEKLIGLKLLKKKDKNLNFSNNLLILNCIPNDIPRKNKLNLSRFNLNLTK